MQQAGPSRRHVLAGAGALVVAACTRDSEPTPRPTADPDGPAREAAIADVRALAALYAAAMVRHPALRPALEPLAAEHTAHLEALGAAPVTGSPSPTTSAASTSGPSPSTSRHPTVPARPEAARQALAAAERATAGRRVSGSTEASPSLARLLASVAACEAAHAALLTAPTRAAG